MKKLVAVFLLAVMLFVCAACGAADTPDDAGTENGSAESGNVEDGSGEENGESGTEQVEDNAVAGGSGHAADAYVSLQKSGVYYMEYTAYAMGVKMDCQVAYRDGNSDSITEMSGFQTHSLYLDGAFYNIDDTNKTYSRIELAEDAADDVMDAAEYSDYVYVSSGKGSIPGLEAVDSAAYDYDEYNAVLEGGETLPMRYYMKNGQLYAIYSSVDDIEIVMLIEKLSADIPAGMLKIPAGYTEQAFTY